MLKNLAVVFFCVSLCVALAGCPSSSKVSVPNVCGMTQAQATTALTSGQLTLGAVTTAASATVPAGRVISQNPAAGASVSPNTTVAIVVSTGPAPSLAWSYTPPAASVLGMSIEQTNDNGYILGGSYTSGYDLYALKLTSAGAFSWDVLYSDETPGASEMWGSEARDVLQTTDGGYIMLGSYGYLLLKLDSDGDIEWSEEYAPANPYSPGQDCVNNLPRVLCVCDDGGFFAAGSSYVGMYNIASVVKTDADGEVKFCKVVNDNNREYDQDIVACRQTSDGGFILSGFSENPDYLALLIKLDEDGIVEWSGTYQYEADSYGAEAYAVAETPDGGFVFGGELLGTSTKVLTHGAWLGKVDENGDLLWMESYGHGTTVHYPLDIEVTPQGDIVVCGEANDARMLIAKFDSDGDLLWNYKLSTIPTANGKDLDLTADGGCIVVGSGVSSGAIIAKINHVYVP